MTLNQGKGEKKERITKNNSCLVCIDHIFRNKRISSSFLSDHEEATLTSLLSAPGNLADTYPSRIARAITRNYTL